MKSISTFIFVHKQEIILEYKKINKFNRLPSKKYVLVGKNPFDLVDGMDDVIICQKFEDNIEDYPRFTSYTGWYLLWKYNLIDTDFVNLFEYDINIEPSIQTVFHQIQNSDLDFVGYLPLFIEEECYIKTRKWVDELINSIKKNYDLDIDNFFNDYLKEKPNGVWSTTSNSTFSKEAFDRYMVWFEKIFEDLKDFEFSGHAHERSISFFYLTQNLKIAISPNVIEHLQLNSHETSDFPDANRFINLYPKLL
jgi:hypothetical protein